MHKLLTIDVWDTLLRRKAHPDLSKLTSARALSLSYGAELCLPFKDMWAIFRERCAIEGELANSSKGGYGEYELQDVLTRLLKRVFISTESFNIQDIAEDLAEFELQFELRHTYPDPTFPSFCRDFPADKTLFLSDFYMSAKSIQRLLKYHALDELVADGISSCDVGLNKRSGKLFEYVHSHFGITPEEHVHIGDNLFADVEVPNNLGIQSIHFEPELEHHKRQVCSAFLNDRMALFHKLSEEVWQTSEQAVNELQGDVKSAYLIGIRSAPMLIGFILHIAEQALMDKIERLFFFTREGELFIRVWRAIFPDNRLAGLELPPVHLLEVSRIATFCASLREISTNEMMRLWNLYSTQSIYALFMTLGLEPDAFVDICQTHGLNLKEDLVYPWQDLRIQALFNDPQFLSLIQAKIDDSRSRLLTYLEQHGWEDDLAKVGIVDIGWRGTIQDNLAYLLPNCQISGYYLGLQHFLNSQPENCKKSAFGPDANQSSDFLNLLDAVSLIEMLCNSPNGSVSGYNRDQNGRMTANRIIDDGENAVYQAFVCHFQEGVLSTSRLWADYVDNHVIVSCELRAPGCSIWHEIVTKKHQDLADAYASLKHNEVFGVGAFVDKSSVPSLSQLFQGVFSQRQRQKVILCIRQTQWTSGIWGRQDLALIHKVFWVGILQLSRVYKRLRYYWWRIMKR